MRQIFYVSRSAVAERDTDLDGIVERSRHNNALEGITGLLWSDGRRFLQVFEGPEDSVAATFDRICEDTRHEAIRVLHDVTIEHREFGGWTMARRSRWDKADAFDEKIRRALSRTSPEVRDAFLDLIAVETAA